MLSIVRPLLFNANIHPCRNQVYPELSDLQSINPVFLAIYWNIIKKVRHDIESVLKMKEKTIVAGRRRQVFFAKQGDCRYC